MEQDLWRYLQTVKKPVVLYGMGNGADKIINVNVSNGASPSGKAAGFGPAISEVRILPSQPIKRGSKNLSFFIGYVYFNCIFL